MGSHSVVGDFVDGITHIFKPRTSAINDSDPNAGPSTDPADIARAAELKKEGQQYQTSTMLTNAAGFSEAPMTTSRMITGGSIGGS